MTMTLLQTRPICVSDGEAQAYLPSPGPTSCKVFYDDDDDYDEDDDDDIDDCHDDNDNHDIQPSAFWPTVHWSPGST